MRALCACVCSGVTCRCQSHNEIIILMCASLLHCIIPSFNPSHVINFVMAMYNSCSCSLWVLGSMGLHINFMSHANPNRPALVCTGCRVYYGSCQLLIHNIYKMACRVFPIILFTFISPVEHGTITTGSASFAYLMHTHAYS